MILIIQIPLNLIAVKILSKGELSGYDLMKKIKEETGYWKPSPGTIYPLLEKLQKRGLVTSRTEGKRNIYTLTPKAKVFLKIADAKKAGMTKYAICCVKMHKFLFGDDVTALIEDEHHMHEQIHRFMPEFHETMELRNIMVSATGQKDPKKIARIKGVLRKTVAEIRKINEA